MIKKNLFVRLKIMFTSALCVHLGASFALFNRTT
jgi:hypothetical protein